MIKPNLHFLRKKHEINEKRIKNLLVLEEQYVYGNISKKMIEDMTRLYQGFISYCEEIKEPMKLYFQEKLEYLYYNEKVFQAVVAAEGDVEGEEEVGLLNNDFLNFSEIAPLEPAPAKEEFGDLEDAQAEGAVTRLQVEAGAPEQDDDEGQRGAAQAAQGAEEGSLTRPKKWPRASAGTSSTTRRSSSASRPKGSTSRSGSKRDASARCRSRLHQQDDLHEHQGQETDAGLEAQGRPFRKWRGAY